MKNIKAIAFYLPQFHEIPENNRAYGKGFTEWTNVKKAVPLFADHNQPRIPLNENYYNLDNIETMIQQAKIAKEYGIYGFCYYHYWFSGGKKLLEKPLEKMLNCKDVDIPFCLCWANENWTKRWDGGNNEIIVKQDYDDLDDIRLHAEYLAQFFSDKRYIYVDSKPILLIYKPELITNCKKYIYRIREEFKKLNFDVMIGFQFPDAVIFGNYEKYCDFFVEFEPSYIQKKDIKDKRNIFQNLVHDIYFSTQFESVRHVLKKKRGVGKLQILDYDDAWKKILNHKPLSDKAMAGAFVDWDNTPRKKNGIVYKGTTVQKFRKYYFELIKKIKKEYKYPFVFINAWNEWGEGAYLEPDVKNQYGYLEVIKDSYENN